MSAAPGTEFPNPCPVCGADDDHAAWREQLGPGAHIGATICPHPSELGHGTGCWCMGRSRPIFGFGVAADCGPYPIPLREWVMSASDIEDSGPALAQRVAALEAAVDRMLNPVATIEWTDEQIAAFKEEFEAAAARFPQHEIRLRPPPLLLDAVTQFLREHVTVVKPGETLVVRVPWSVTPHQLYEYQRVMDSAEGGKIPFRVIVVAGEELGVVPERQS